MENSPCLSENVVSSLSTAMSLKKDKCCLVCGDKALGYNFNAVSCESCKAFFRRNAHKTIRGRCEGKCDVNVESRSFCKKCRLHKCFVVGMRKDMILNAEQKLQRKQKIIINKLRRQGQMPPSDTYAVSEVEIAQLASYKASNLPESSDSSSSLKQEPGFSKSAEKGIENQVSAPKPTFPPWESCKEEVQNIIATMADDEQLIIKELQSACEATSFLTNSSTTLRNIPGSASEFVNIAEVFVRRLIKLSKNISFFKELTKDDQVSLLKGSVVEIMMLRSVINYDPATESWSLNTASMMKGSSALPGAQKMSGVDTSNLPGTSKNTGSKISAQLLKMGGPETQSMFLTYTKFVKSLMASIRGDLLILKLLIMLSLFASDRTDLVKADIVQLIQEKYAGVLKNYISLRFPDSQSLFAKMVMKLTDLRNINEVHTKMLLRMKPEDIEPLLIEIFDLT